jgi:hypothetical protein
MYICHLLTGFLVTAARAQSLDLTQYVLTNVGSAIPNPPYKQSANLSLRLGMQMEEIHFQEYHSRSGW